MPAAAPAEARAGLAGGGGCAAWPCVLRPGAKGPSVGRAEPLGMRRLRGAARAALTAWLPALSSCQERTAAAALADAVSELGPGPLGVPEEENGAGGAV